MGLGNWLKKIRGWIKHDVSPEQLDELKRTFRTRYRAFKSLATQNQSALQGITEIESTLSGDVPFDMSFVRSRCTDISNSVFQIIEHLNEIAPQKYEGLFARWQQLKEQIDAAVDAKQSTSRGPLTVVLGEIDRHFADQTGSKMATLGELSNHDELAVPDGFVVTADAYRQFMAHNKIQPEIDRLMQSCDRDDIQELQALSKGIAQFIIGCHLPKDLEAELATQYARLEAQYGKNVSVAMRSSALGEDGQQMSFAGQYRTVFNVNRKNLFLAYKEVVASKYQIQAMMYRLNMGIRDERVAMCVGCLPLIDVRVGGVAYTGNPLDENQHDIMIHSVWGHPKPVVDGRTATDLFVVAREAPFEILKKLIADKQSKYVFTADDGIVPSRISPEQGQLPSLDDTTVATLTAALIEIENHFGEPQDVEWVIDQSGKLFILQSRPLKQQRTTSSATADDHHKPSVPPIVEGGICASPGVASGPVFVAESKKDALSFPEGGVLVVAQSIPYWAILLNRASAVITEQGSVAGHLANVAREFGVPAIFGLPEATAQLAANATITVDADHRQIYEGEQPSLLRRQKKNGTKLKGSPTFNALQEAAGLIVPLRLLDPDSDQFQPQHCQTMHDIIRFCHEKSVAELFDVERGARLGKSLSRQLYHDVPMQYWIIDLDDGIHPETAFGRYVRIDDIVSRPMLALWRGITAVQWSGPPPTDAKGFVSVLMGSAADPSLNPDMPSVYSEGNHFLISKEFCSFQSRFGYHFATVESVVTDVAEENYIRFHFKGGAANITRREARIELISEMLTAANFRVEVSGDAVVARVERYDRRYMESRLEILGYLTVHTRQLDMVMNNQATVARYRQKMFGDIQRLATPVGE